MEQLINFAFSKRQLNLLLILSTLSFLSFLPSTLFAQSGPTTMFMVPDDLDTEAIEALIMATRKLNATPEELKNLEELERLTQEQRLEAKMKNESYFNRLRYELNKLNTQSARLAEQRGIPLNSAMHLPATKMAFHVLDGGIYFLESWIRADSNPLKLIEHWESTDEPTGWFSFYVFMVSQGYYIDFKSRNLSIEMKAQMMRSLMYKGMIFGSLISTITVDVYNSFKACQWARLDRKSKPEEIDKACDAALQVWTGRNLINKFGPQILNLVANQVASDLTEAAVRSAARSKTGQYIGSSIVGNIESMMLFKRVELVINIVPGGWYVKGARYFLTGMKFGNFLLWDHLLRPTMYKYGGNLTALWNGNVDAGSIERLSNWFSTQRWDLENLRARSDDRVLKFPEALADFSALMSEWRRQLNLKAEEDLDGWVKVQSNLVHQIQYLNSAYRKVSDIVYKGAARDSLPFIPLPLYGVNPGYDEKEKPHYNQYILNNSELQKDQLIRLKKVVSDFESEFNRSEFVNRPYTSFTHPLAMERRNHDLKFVIQLLQDLKSDDTNTIAKGLHSLNMVLPPVTPEPIHKLLRTTEVLLEKLRKNIGDPRPIINPGLAFAFAFDSLDTSRTMNKAANFPIAAKHNGIKLNFENPMSYMLYFMMCGENKAAVAENSTIAYTIAIPRITTYQSENETFCKELVKSGPSQWNDFALRGLDATAFFTKEINGASVLEYLTNKDNLQYDFHGIGSKENLFGKWWKRHEGDYVKELKKFDARIKPLVQQTAKNFSNVQHFDMDPTTKVSDALTKYKIFSDYLPNTIKESLVFQLRVLLKMYKSYLDRNASKNFVLGKDYIKQIKVQVEKDNAHFNFEKNVELLSALSKIRDDFLKKHTNTVIEMELTKIFILSKALKKRMEKDEKEMKISFDFGNLEKEIHSKPELFKRLHDFINESSVGSTVKIDVPLLVRVMACSYKNGPQPVVKIKNIEKDSNKGANVGSKKDPVCGPTKDLTTAILKSLQSKDSSFVVDFLQTLSNTKLYLVDKAAENNDQDAKKQAEELDLLQSQISKNHSGELFEYFAIDLIELFQNTAITSKILQQKKMHAEIYLKVFFESSLATRGGTPVIYENLSSFKQSKSLDKRFQYSIFEGFSNVLSEAARYSFLNLGLEQQLSMPKETLQGLIQGQTDRSDKANALKTSTGYRP